MNRNQVKGTAKDVAGKVQETVGKITGNASQQVKGTAKQVEGKVQKGAGDVQEAARDADKDNTLTAAEAQKDTKVQGMWKQLDRNGDGKVTRDEFKAYQSAK